MAAMSVYLQLNRVHLLYLLSSCGRKVRTSSLADATFALCSGFPFVVLTEVASLDVFCRSNSTNIWFGQLL